MTVRIRKKGEIGMKVLEAEHIEIIADSCEAKGELFIFDDTKYMSKEIYEKYCKDCPRLQECKDWGVGCEKVVSVTLSGDTYTASEGTE